MLYVLQEKGKTARGRYGNARPIQYVLQEKGENVMRVVWVRQLELEFILTVEGYAVCFAGEGGRRHEGSLRTPAKIHSDHRGLCMLYVLQEKEGGATRAVWGRHLVFILAIEGYPAGERERQHEGGMGTPPGVHSGHRGLSCRRKGETARGRYGDARWSSF